MQKLLLRKQATQCTLQSVLLFLKYSKVGFWPAVLGMKENKDGCFRTKQNKNKTRWFNEIYFEKPWQRIPWLDSIVQLVNSSLVSSKTKLSRWIFIQSRFVRC